MNELGKILVVIGIIATAIGLALWLGGNKFNWIGRLPGDIRIEKEHINIHIPITTMILISILLTLGTWLFRRLF